MITTAPSDRMITINQPSGWICPVCGKSCAPTMRECNHMPLVTISGICFIGGGEPLEKGDIEVHTKSSEAI
jgi:hypothetical protein